MANKRMVSGGEGWIVSKEYGEDFIDWHEDCDIGFRKGIVDTLTAISMDIEAIEEGIEKNANLWRNAYMRKAFLNRFDSTFDHLGCEIAFADKEHEAMWIKWRKFEYYQRHKKSVDLYSPRDYSSDNVYSPNIEDLNLSDEEAAQVYVYLLKKNEERKRYIEECKADPTKKRELKFTVNF